MGRLSKKFGWSDEEPDEPEETVNLRDEQLYGMQLQPEPETTIDEERETEMSYEDVPIQVARDIKKKPTPKGYFRTVISGIPVDLHSLEDYIVKTSPFAIKTIMRFDNARNIEEIKQYSTKSTGKKKLGIGFFILIMFLVIMVIVGILLMMKGPELIEFFKFGGGI